MSDQVPEAHDSAPATGAVGSLVERGVRPVEPERDARWMLAADVAHGRMVGGWVPVDADLVLALHARLTALRATLLDARDCRTCRNFTPRSGGCVSVLRCVDGSSYQRQGRFQYWEAAPETPAPF